MIHRVWQNSNFIFSKQTGFMPISKLKKTKQKHLSWDFFCCCHAVLVLWTLLSLKRKLPQSLLALQNLLQIPPLSASPPLFIWNIHFLLTREELLLILPWNSGQYSGAVLGYLIKSQYAPLSLASTSGNDFARGRLCACVRVWCVLLEMNCFCLFLIDCGTGLHIHHGASLTASSPAATLMNQKLWLEDSKAC